ncbi:LamG domain-containing protein [Candidatus Gracilibacteria bacterium]|nr:LamG domain-containing protein [Candidatus Gracilibacteria bacterium]
MDDHAYQIGQADGTLVDMPDSDRWVDNSESVTGATPYLNFWDTLLKKFFKATFTGILDEIPDKHQNYKTASEITTIDTSNAALPYTYYWDTTLRRYCRGKADGSLECWDTCLADCSGKECGSDGCGGVCGVCMGTCAAGTCTLPLPTSQLLAYYPYTGNTNDVSGNNFNASNLGATLTTDRNGNANSAYDFNGSSATMMTPIDETDLATNNGRDFSVAVWVRAEGWGTCPSTNSCAYNKIVLSNRAGGRGFLFGFTGAGAVSPSVPGQIQFLIGSGCTLSQVISDTTIPLNTWEHVVVSLDYNESNNNSEIALYLNGVRVPTKVRYAENCVVGPWTSGSTIEQSNVLISSAANMRIGNDATIYSYYYFDGQMDEIALYDRALSAAEVDDIYQYFLTQ